MVSQPAGFALRPFEPTDTASLLALNQHSEQVLSPLTAKRFTQLRQQAALLWVAESEAAVAGFLMGFTAGAAYDSVNYQWFNARLQHFFYIDRIVIGASARGQGLGQAFYRELQRWAQHRSLHWLAAEIDIAPANPASLHFHQQQDFVAVAEQGAGHKRVSLQLKSLTKDAPADEH